jgi:hypothetical protein
MTAIVTALVGLIGVLVGTLLAALLQRRNWRLQATMESYARLDAEGGREIEILECLERGAPFGDKGLISAARAKLGAAVESPFLQAIAQCWLLERDPAIRVDLRELERIYKKARERCGMQVDQSLVLKQEPGPSRNGLYEAWERKMAGMPTPEQARQLFERIRETVAGEYFHGEGQAQNASNEDH